MSNLVPRLTLEFVVKDSTSLGRLVILSGSGAEVGRVLSDDGLNLVLADYAGNRWVLHPRNVGDPEPFSIRIDRKARESKGGTETVLTIRQGLFVHNSKVYMFAGIPTGIDAADVILGKKLLVRLDQFPFERVQDIDAETIGRLRRFYRGTLVGEITGLGSQGHRVRLSDELSAVALPLSVSSYLLYSAM